MVRRCRPEQERIASEIPQFGRASSDRSCRQRLAATAESEAGSGIVEAVLLRSRMSLTEVLRAWLAPPGVIPDFKKTARGRELSNCRPPPLITSKTKLQRSSGAAQLFL